MKILVTAAALMLSGAAHAQTPPPRTPALDAGPIQTAPAPPTSSLTRDLNSGPPAPAVYLAPAPAPTAETEVQAAPPPARTPAPLRSVTPPPASGPATPLSGVVTPRPAPIPTNPAPSPGMAPVAPPRSALPNPAPTPSAPVTPPVAPPAAAPSVPTETPRPPPPAMTVLDSAARAALPFTAELPPGFEIVTGRPGPDFRIYTIRRGDRSFVMIYAGPASQFPIYSGQMVEGGGRASIVSDEDGERHAIEHLFQRSSAPREVHVWTMSLEGADRALAEEIAQSVDVR